MLDTAFFLLMFPLEVMKVLKIIDSGGGERVVDALMLVMTRQNLESTSAVILFM